MPCVGASACLLVRLWILFACLGACCCVHLAHMECTRGGVYHRGRACSVHAGMGVVLWGARAYVHHKFVRILVYTCIHTSTMPQAETSTSAAGVSGDEGEAEELAQQQQHAFLSELAAADARPVAGTARRADTEQRRSLAFVARFESGSTGRHESRGSYDRAVAGVRRRTSLAEYVMST